MGCLASNVAKAEFGQWVVLDKARARLIAAGIGKDGRLEAGIEIMLDPGWKTYWRTPGAAGLPPVIDFGASGNLGAVEVRFPVPERDEDEYGVSNVYHDGVMLPVEAEVPDPAAPIDLRLALDFGVCEEVCIPEHIEAEVNVQPGVVDRLASATLAGARAQLPGPPVPGVLSVDAVQRSGGDETKPDFELTVSAPADAELFVEGPADWYSGAPERVADDGDKGVYRVTFDRLGAKTPIKGASLRVTIVADGKAVEQSVALD